MNRARVAALILAFGVGLAAAAPAPDPTFGVGGFTIPEVGPPGAFSEADHGVLIDARSGIVFVNTAGDMFLTSTGLRRLQSDGTIDAEFGIDGRAGMMLRLFPAGGSPARIYSALALDSSHRILCAVGDEMYETVWVWRHFDSGLRDLSFGDLRTDAEGRRERHGNSLLWLDEPHPIVDIATQLDGKVLVVVGARYEKDAAGTKRITVIRLTDVGEFDETFGDGGIVRTAIPGGTGLDIATAVAVQGDGKIVVAGRTRRVDSGYDAVVLRYQSNGVLDAGFGTAGVARVSFPGKSMLGRRIVIQPDGAIAGNGTLYTVAGTVGDAGFFRLRSNGTLDPGFGIGGRTTVTLGPGGGVVYSFLRRMDGRYVSVGYRSRGEPGEDLESLSLGLTALGTRDVTWDADGYYAPVPPGYSESYALSAVNRGDRLVVTGNVWDGAHWRWFVSRLLIAP